MESNILNTEKNSNLNLNSNGPVENSPMTMSEYTDSVRSWLLQYHWWNQMNYFTSCQLYATHMSAFQQAQLMSSGLSPQQSPSQPNFSQTAPPNASRTTPAQRQPQVLPGVEYQIPSPWKRLAAEFIDFMILFVLKLFLTLVVVDYIELLNISHYDWEKLADIDFTLDNAITMSTELFAMEVINRIITCFYEAMCLRHGVGGTIGGTTPGKRAMGIKVVFCTHVSPVTAGRVRVSPASDLGFWRAFVRSFLKNFSLALFFPVFLTVLFNPHNRATYDVISSSVVVEEERQN